MNGTPSSADVGSGSVVVFRQAGNNVRLGNTLVWVATAQQWCQRRGFGFCFPAAPRVLGALLHPSSPLLAMPPGLDPAWFLGGPALEGSRAQAVDALLVKLLALGREAATGLGQTLPMVTLMPSALGCIVDTRGLDWESPAVADFVRAHRVCIVNEPHPFTVATQPPPEQLRSLLPPSAEAAAVMEAVASTPAPTLGIHVRQTDYRRWQGGRFFRDNAFYNELALRALQLLPAGGRVFLAHDGEFVADAALAAEPRIAVSDGTEAAVTRDFVTFAACDLLVGAQSTFTIQALRLGQLWSPKRRDLLRLQPESSVDDLLAAVQARLVQRGS